MAPDSMAQRIAAILAKDSSLAFDLFCAASEIVDDFEDFGPILQANLAGDYDETTAVQRLRAVRGRVKVLLDGNLEPRGFAP